MAETLSSHIEGKIEGFKGTEFIPDSKERPFRLKTPIGQITIIHGHTDGKQTAMVFGADSPPELALGGEDARLSRGLLSRLGNSQLGRIAAGITMAAGAIVGAGATLGACSPNNANNNPDQPTGLSTNQSALTYDQVLNVGPGQLIPWSEWGDEYSNYGEMNGEKYIFVGRSWGGDDSVVYVKCQAIEDCLAADANVQTVQGLEEAGLNGLKAGPGVYQDQNGNNKFIVNPTFGPNQICDIAENANSVLEVSGCEETNPLMNATVSIFVKDGVPYALYAGGAGMKLRNLHTGNIQNIPFNFDWASSCGVGFEAGDVVVGTNYQFYGGIDHCRLITAPTWEELANNLTALESLNNTSNVLAEPRLAAGNILIYARYDMIPGPDGYEESRLWYAVIPDVPQPNPEPDAGVDAGADTQSAHTDVPIIPSPDTGPTPDALANEVADAADTAVAQPPDASPQPDTAPGQDTTPGPDTSPDAGQDTGKPPQPDTSPNPDTPAPSCDFAQAKIQITEGACLLENCTDPSVDITGKCTFEVDLGNPNPVIIEVDGTYQIDLFEKLGALLSGKYKVVDNGNKFGTAAGDFLIGVEGTIYRGELPIGTTNYYVACDEGKITIYLVKQSGEKIALITLEAGDEHTFDMDNPTANLTEPTPEQDQDTGPTGNDTTKPDTTTPPTPGKDTATTDTSKPSTDTSSSGCSCSTTPPVGNFTELGLSFLAIAGFLAARRKKTKKE